MLEQLQNLALELGIPEQTFLIAGIGAGILMFTVGIGAILGERNPAADRISAVRNEKAFARANRGLLREEDRDPSGVWKAVMPADMEKRAEMTRKLARAGLNGKHSLRNYLMLRVLLGFGLPALLIGLVILSRSAVLDVSLGPIDRLAALSDQTLGRVAAILVALGYFVPAKWLDDRAKQRQLKVEQAFPNALDLMQVSVAAGLGFDAAMTRVGNEMAEVAPEIAFELLTVQRQIQAGRPRDLALRDMALRTGVDTVRSFANVVSQSMQLGTPMSEALNAYASEMRIEREMRAQEAANKLPVKFSAVLASLMLPALVMLTVGPVVIRYIRFFE